VELDRIAVRVFDQDLLAAGSLFDGARGEYRAAVTIARSETAEVRIRVR
jgi:hypothetical protein